MKFQIGDVLREIYHQYHLEPCSGYYASPWRRAVCPLTLDYLVNTLKMGPNNFDIFDLYEGNIEKAIIKKYGEAYVCGFIVGFDNKPMPADRIKTSEEQFNLGYEEGQKMRDLMERD